MNNPDIDGFGTKRWYDEDDRLHREGAPAVERANGDYIWSIHGKLHRLDGPAVKIGNVKEWYYLGKSLPKIRSQKKFERWLKLRVFL